MRTSLFLALLLGGCASAAPYVPSLVVRGALVSRAAASDGRARSALDWQVRADLRWALDRAPPRLPELVRPALSADHRGYPCAIPALCAWERRAREAALAAFEGGVR